MSKKLGNALRAAREGLQITQARVAAELKVTRAAVGQWENGTSEPSTARLIHLCNFLGINITAATGGQVQLTEHPQVSEDEADNTREFLVQDRRPGMRDVTIGLPVDSVVAKRSLGGQLQKVAIVETRGIYGSLSISNEHVGQIEPEFVIGNEIVDIVERPLGLIQARDVEAYYINTDFNEPRFFIGDLIFVDHKRSVRPGDFVVVRFNERESEKEGGGSFAQIGRMRVRATSETIIEQLNPERRFVINSEWIKAVSRILTTNDLFGK